jgi:hypothetical protein
MMNLQTVYILAVGTADDSMSWVLFCICAAVHLIQNLSRQETNFWFYTAFVRVTSCSRYRFFTRAFHARPCVPERRWTNVVYELGPFDVGGDEARSGEVRPHLRNQRSNPFAAWRQMLASLLKLHELPLCVRQQRFA